MLIVWETVYVAWWQQKQTFVQVPTDAQCTTQAHLNIHADLIEDTLDTIINQLTQCKVGFVVLLAGQGVEDVDNATLELIGIAYKRSHSLLLSWSLIS